MRYIPAKHGPSLCSRVARYIHNTRRLLAHLRPKTRCSLPPWLVSCAWGTCSYSTIPSLRTLPAGVTTTDRVFLPQSVSTLSARIVPSGSKRKRLATVMKDLVWVTRKVWVWICRRHNLTRLIAEESLHAPPPIWFRPKNRHCRASLWKFTGRSRNFTGWSVNLLAGQ